MTGSNSRKTDDSTTFQRGSVRSAEPRFSLELRAHPPDMPPGRHTPHADHGGWSSLTAVPVAGSAELADSVRRVPVLWPLADLRAIPNVADRASVASGPAVTRRGYAGRIRSSGCSEFVHWPTDPAEKNDRSIRYRATARRRLRRSAVSSVGALCGGLFRSAHSRIDSGPDGTDSR